MFVTRELYAMPARAMRRDTRQRPSLDATVTIPSTILCQTLEQDMVLLNLSTGTYFGLDPIGSRMWQHLQKDGRLQSVLARLLEEFDVEADRLTRDLLQLVASLHAHGLVRYA